MNRKRERENSYVFFISMNKRRRLGIAVKERVEEWARNLDLFLFFLKIKMTEKPRQL